MLLLLPILFCWGRGHITRAPNICTGLSTLYGRGFYSLYPFGVSNYDPNTTLFKDVEYRNPILPRGFHADIQTIVFQQPVRTTVQIRIKGAESLLLIVGLQAVCGGGDDGSNQECFVNIYTAAGWEYDFHNKTSSIKL